MRDLNNVKSVINGHTGETLFESAVPNEVLNWYDNLGSDYRSVYSVYDVHPALRMRYHTRLSRGELWLVPHGF